MLFVENLPEATTDTMLALLFEQFPGGCRSLQRVLCHGRLFWHRAVASPPVDVRMAATTRASKENMTQHLHACCIAAAHPSPAGYREARLVPFACQGTEHRASAVASLLRRLPGGPPGAQPARHRLCGL